MVSKNFNLKHQGKLNIRNKGGKRNMYFKEEECINPFETLGPRRDAFW